MSGKSVATQEPSAEKAMDASRSNPSVTQASEPTITLDSALDALRDQEGRSLRQICDDRPTLVCLLRHNGCTFCRETIAELGRQKDQVLRAGLAIAVVGMSESGASLKALGDRFGLSDVAWIADPDRLLYRALGVGRGNFLQLLGPRVLWSGWRAVLRGYGLGRPKGDPFQMPGTVVIHRARVLRRYVHRSAADRPDYEAFACERPA